MTKCVVMSMLCLVVVPQVAYGETVGEGSEESMEATGTPRFRINEWQIQLGPGVEFFALHPPNFYNGPAFRLIAQRLGWRGHFMFGGGASFQYSYVVETDHREDNYHLMTFNGDFVLGGGTFEKWALYLHVMFGIGPTYRTIYKGQNWMYRLRGHAGIGGWFHITPLISLGVLIDVGVPLEEHIFPLFVDGLLTVGFHFGKG